MWCGVSSDRASCALQAHACVGVVLSWALPTQWGLDHVNCHSLGYVINLFNQLGYRQDKELTRTLRRGARGARAPSATSGPRLWYLRYTLIALRRIQPLDSCV